MSDYKSPITGKYTISDEEMKKVMDLVRKWAPLMESTASNSSHAILLESEEKYFVEDDKG
jgi:hypothetical protein